MINLIKHALKMYKPTKNLTVISKQILLTFPRNRCYLGIAILGVHSLLKKNWQVAKRTQKYYMRPAGTTFMQREVVCLFQTSVSIFTCVKYMHYIYIYVCMYVCIYIRMAPNQLSRTSQEVLLIPL
jgi:hypothetical protein